MKRLLVNKIIPFSNVDGEGNRTAIFLQGCNYNCSYCHNPETINKCEQCGVCSETCPEGALTFSEDLLSWDNSKCTGCDECIKICPNNSSPKAIEMTVSDIISEIEPIQAFIRGITISGGECTLQSQSLIELISAVKKLDLSCYVDSNGSLDFKEMEQLTDLIDGAMIDLKSFDSVEHHNLTGMDNTRVLDNIKYLGAINKLLEVRTVIVPEVLDNKRTVQKTAQLFGSNKPFNPLQIDQISISRSEKKHDQFHRTDRRANGLLPKAGIGDRTGRCYDHLSVF